MVASDTADVPTHYPLVNITLPVYNEAAQLATNVRRVAEFLAGFEIGRWEIVIAENGSTDGSREIAERLTKEIANTNTEIRGRLIKGQNWLRETSCPMPETGCQRTETDVHKPEEGYEETERTIRVWVVPRDAAGRGGALRAAWLASEADILSYMDVDLSTDLTCLPALLAPLLAGTADVAIGSRLLPGSKTTRGWKRELLSRGYNRLWLLRAALGLRVADA